MDLAVDVHHPSPVADSAEHCECQGEREGVNMASKQLYERLLLFMLFIPDRVFGCVLEGVDVLTCLSVWASTHFYAFIDFPVFILRQHFLIPRDLSIPTSTPHTDTLSNSRS